ncbi:hypothetical protein [Nocardia sp. X0981]
MKGGSRIALGVGIGYLLGRTRKMRWAMAMAGAAMSKRSTGVTTELLKRGASQLDSAELGKITETVRGELLGAVRSAAVTAASNRIDALNDRLQHPPGSRADEEDTEDRRGVRETEPEETDEDLDEYAADEAENEPARPAPRSSTRRSGTTKGSKASSRTSSRASGSAAGGTAATRRRRARTETDDAAPVRRTRR